MSEKWRVACYGMNGHQIVHMLVDYASAELVAVADISDESLEGAFKEDPDRLSKVARYSSLDELLADANVQVVSLCSARRAEQVDHAVQCLEAGKHVVAEKPVALDLEGIQKIKDAVAKTGCKFHGMAGTVHTPPFRFVQHIVQSGQVGPVVQVYAMKSYPYHDRRPRDRGIDGGMIPQAGSHAIRLMEGVTGLKLKRVCGFVNALGIKDPGGLNRAASLAYEYDSGAVGILALNYLNQRSIGYHGNDQIRVMGTEGMIEAVDGAERITLVTADQPPTHPEPPDVPHTSFYDQFFQWLRDGTPVEPTPDQELRTTEVLYWSQRAADEQKMFELPD